MPLRFIIAIDYCKGLIFTISPEIEIASLPMCIIFELNMSVIYDITYVICLDFCCKTDIIEMNITLILMYINIYFKREHNNNS